jgi:hypothetical protein
MTFFVPHRAGVIAFALGVLPVFALAQAPAPSARPWTDPPARGAAEAKPGPRADTPAEAKAPETRETSKRTAAAKRPPTPVASRSTHAAAPPQKVAAARPAHRIKVAARAVVPHRPVVSAVPRTRVASPAIRVVTMRPAAYAPPPPAFRGGYAMEAAPFRPMSYEDERLRRIRQAQAAGYLVVRARSVEFPDGRRLRTYRPYVEESDD